jgi:hypothetical protein
MQPSQHGFGGQKNTTTFRCIFTENRDECEKQVLPTPIAPENEVFYSTQWPGLAVLNRE